MAALPISSISRISQISQISQIHLILKIFKIYKTFYQGDKVKSSNPLFDTWISNPADTPTNTPLRNQLMVTHGETASSFTKKDRKYYLKIRITRFFVLKKSVFFFFLIFHFGNSQRIFYHFLVKQQQDVI